jgi:large subunit ribosomal protein L3
MINTLLGIKKGMTSTYDARGRRVGATIISVEPNVVTQIKTTESKDGYSAVQIGIGSKKSVRKPQLGHFKKAGTDKTLRFVRETKVDTSDDVTLGKEIKVSEIFKTGDSVKVTGVSKGRGFQGGVKRYNFRGGPKTHGQSDRHRAPGSIGQTTTPGRVYKGKHMAGHMGVDTVSVRNLEVVSIDRKNNTLTVKGGIPGAQGMLVQITRLGVMKGYTAPPEPEPEEEEEVKTENAQSNEVETQSSTEEVVENTAESVEPVSEEGEQNG